MNPPRISVVVPLYNEEATVPELLRRLGAVLSSVEGGPHEMLFVDDGSVDRTVPLLAEAAQRDPRIRVVVFSRNFGHQAAISAALDHATGDAVVAMDGDLQDVPEAIPRFLEKLAEGCDVAYARRVRRKEPWWLRASYFVFYRMLARFSNVQLPLDAGDFGIMSRRVVDLIRQSPERHRYLRGLRAWAGFRQCGIDVERGARHAGESKYGLRKLLRLASDAVFSFSVAPLRAAALSGLAAIAFAALFAAYAIYVRLAHGRTPEGFTALIVVIVFLSGVQLLFLGVLGEYLGRVYEQVKGRPTYVVARVIGGKGGS